ncbi:glycosyl transferase family 1 [Shewanella sp. Choline-02u-19]|uniref:glycosyltransferase n=1 Tax=unclassified Shewanella TaxID=196818 RepID=UPI000C332848|nr:MULTISPECIES: glycosyltransferase [unclassified Shewanella]PKH56699.1 glycosyl transferase family 1 [Shewanella sp. Bg11-22]PKI30250.1 glycosyl transferase family 1 [Shewanella sp. Choline-02u-19]
MRPKVIHLIDDVKLGGVNLALESLAASRLNQHFDFQLRHIELSQLQLTRYDANIIVIHGAISWRKIPALVILKLANRSTPLLYQEHHYCREFMRHCVRHPYRFKMMLKLGYRLMDKVLTVSDQQADWLIEFGALNEKKVARVGQAKELANCIALTGVKPYTPLRLVAYGRLAKQKGFDLLIQAMANFSEQEVTLAIAGDGEDRESLQQLAKSMPQVTLVGEVDDVAAFLSTADAVVIPSRWEPFGLTCMESIAAGRHVILPEIDGLADQIAELSKHQQGYEVIESLSVEGITQAITRVKNGNQIGVNGEQRQATQQAWEKMLVRWQQLLAQYL